MNIALPIPPSVNQLYRQNAFGKGRGRTITPAYSEWRIDAYARIRLARSRPIAKPYAVCIRININHNSDIDNRVKAILDALVATRVIAGDQWVDDCRIIRDASVEACDVEIWSLGDSDA